MRTMNGRRAAAAALVVVVAAATLMRDDVAGLGFVLRAADVHGVMRAVADARIPRVDERTIVIAPLGIRARLYAPAAGARRVALLVSGLHPAGIDEPRLVNLARDLAESGVAVVTPDIPQLSRFEIVPAITDAIETSALWLARDSGLASDGRVGLMGISFSGGLAIVAAGRASIRERVAYVFSFGGHDDLPRVLRFLCTGDEDGSAAHVRPHDYGVAVILLGIADRLVPPEQVDALRVGVRRFLWASHLDRVDHAAAEREYAALRALAETLPEPSATLLRYVNDRDVEHLGPRLVPYIGEYGEAPGLSPSRSAKPSAPVFLLHGTDDNVIPAEESVRLQKDLEPYAPVRILLSGLISHAEADRPMHVADVAKLAGFWGDLLGR
jgi:dienelactone hydrolase